MKKRLNLLKPILALISGALLALAFAPFNWLPIAFIAPALLLYIWLTDRPLVALLHGWLFGVGLFGVGTSWVYVSIHNFGNANVLLAGFITFLFVAILSLFTGSLGYCFVRLSQHQRLSVRCLVSFPTLWVLWEWLRTWLFTGFPWLFLGYSQLGSSLKGYAPYFGIYSISLMVAFISGALLLLIIHHQRRLKILLVATVVALFAVGALLTPLLATKPEKALTATLIQGNIGQRDKWNESYLPIILTLYKNMTQKYWQSDIIVWPEAAIPTAPQFIKDYMQTMDKAAKQHKTAIILGAPTFNLFTQQYFNSMLVIGEGSGQYDKRHLVPFGEYIPLKSLFAPAMKYFSIPMSDLTPGQWQQPTLKAKGYSVAGFICYEIAYPNEVLQSTKNKQMIVVINDDSWFGDSLARDQQLQFAQMRALETGRYVLYATNTGVSAIVNPKGRIVVRAPINKLAVISAKIYAMTGSTPLMIWGYWPILGLIFMMLVLSLFVARSPAADNKSP